MSKFFHILQSFCTRTPYSIGGDKGLLAVMGIKQNQKPNRIREQLETVLLDLESEKVISH
ncbi:hypothetical protein CN568_29355 [Bacillus pseudomycoides]|nr:hypothetical protein CON70_04710 [Bacillus pseudomycoides]PDZ72988.1 hypothetical protein CON58_14475 [Bacillus pseudomycoides]PEF22861.1 hypothetical protein CON69_19970 [Bacillus pseudomycoides]PEJ23267.1 hypothetical protein CN887_20965 [Bacillus pseudomycoides]PEK30669.1 hypothetical protein CN691_19370 [Bacillus pseudomycoides]